MSDLGFLDDLATSPADTDNDKIENTSPPVEDNETESTENSKYPNVVEVRADDADLSDLRTATEFANELTVRNITERGMGADGVVQLSAVYSVMRAVRNPLPVVMVGGSAYLPVPAAVQAWDARPVRGEGSGTGTGGRLSDEDLFKASSNARNKVDSLQRRLTSVTDRLAAAQKLLDKRTRQLTERGKSFADVEQWESENEVVADDDNE